jgi:hypothetical protein
MADAVSVSDLDHLWDPKAEPLFTSKPREWVATYLPRYCQSVSDRTDSDCRGLALAVRELNRDGFWEQLFPDWETCCLALFKRPAAWVEQVVRGVRVLHAQGHNGPIDSSHALAAMAERITPAGPPPAQGMPSPNPAGVNQHTNRDERKGNDSCPSLPRITGNRQDAILRRIKRDHPDIADRLERGEFRSARAAGLAAGFIKPAPPTIRLVPDPVKVAAAIRKHLDQQQVASLVEELLR